MNITANDMGEQKEMTQLMHMNERITVKLSLTKPIKISSELYNIEKCRWKMSTYGYRMLFAISQCVEENMLFREISIPKNMLFKYLGLEKSNRKYELLLDALTEIQSSGIELRSTNESGKRRWIGMSWITMYDFSEGGKLVYLDINDKAIPFLCALKQYALVQPKTYLRLFTDYQNWLYPLLKMRTKIGRWEVSIDYIYESLDLEHTKSYSKENRNYIANILKYIIGIQPSEDFKNEQKLASKEKRKPKPVAWDYSKGKDGNPVGTLYTIHTETDINVCATVEKEGKSYKRVVFLVSEKIETMSTKRKNELHEEIINGADYDMGKVQDRHGRIGERMIVNTNPAYLTEKIEASPVFYDDDDLKELINPDFGLNTIADVAEKTGYRKHPNGKWYKI